MKTAINLFFLASAGILNAQFTPPTADRAAITTDAGSGAIVGPSSIDWSNTPGITIVWPVFSDASIPSLITRDTEWDTTAKINAFTTDFDFITIDPVTDAVAETVNFTGVNNQFTGGFSGSLSTDLITFSGDAYNGVLRGGQVFSDTDGLFITPAAVADYVGSALGGAASVTHANTHASGGTDPVTPESIGAATAAQGSLADTAVQPDGNISIEGTWTLGQTGSFDLASGDLILPSSVVGDTELASAIDAFSANPTSAQGFSASQWRLDLGLSATDDVQFNTVEAQGLTGTSLIELGNGVDTTLTRSAPGVLAVEGVPLLTADTSNVTAAGALMDSEVANLGAVKAFNPSDYTSISALASADNLTLAGFDLADPAVGTPHIDYSGSWELRSAGIRILDLRDDFWVDIYRVNELVYAGEENRWYDINGSGAIDLNNRILEGSWNHNASPMTAPKYPVFHLTPPPRSTGAWTDFELKASRTNFGKGGVTPEMVYYYHSPGVSGSEIGTEPDVWHTDSGHTDVREWRKLPAGTSLAANLTDANAVPGGIIVVVTDPAVADSANDPDLVWSLVWFDSTGPQEDASASGRQIWRAVTPTRYVGQTFAP